MGVIATLLPEPGRVNRVRSAIRDRHSVLECGGWEDLLETCETHPVHLVVLDLYAEGAANFEAMRTLRRRFPHCSVVAYMSFAANRAHDLFDAGRCGLDGLVLADHDDSPRALLGILEQSDARSLGSRLRTALAGVDETACDALLLAVTRAHERLSPGKLADILGLSRRVVSQRLADAGLPGPHRLLTWARLLVAAHMLEDPRRSADRVALTLDFPSGSAFRNSCQRYLHATPQQIRARGGAAYVTRVLLRQIKTKAILRNRPSQSHARGTRLRVPEIAV